MNQKVAVDEFFSSKRKDIKSKFITENAIVEETNTTPIVPEETDNRPLYQRIADARRIKDEGNNN